MRHSHYTLTPAAVRVRKRILDHSKRKSAGRT